MKQSSHTKKTLKLAWPLALNALLMQSMLMIDTLLVSPLGEIPLAAMGIATTIVFFVFGIQFALSNGTQLIVGRAFGSQDKRALFLALLTGLSINVFFALLFLGAIALFGELIAASLTDDAEIALQVGYYLAISQFLIVLNAITQSLAAFFNGSGKTSTPFTAYVIELPVNTCISYLLIFGIDENFVLWSLLQTLGLAESLSFAGLGLQGAALGSLCAIFVRLLYLSAHLCNANLQYISMSFKEFMSDCSNHFKEASPIAANFILLSIGNTIYLLLFSQLDVYSYVAVTLIFPWMRMGTQFISAWAQASAIFISQLIGQSQSGAIKHLFHNSIKIGLSMALVVAAGFYVLSTLMPHIYSQIDAKTQLALSSIAPLYVLLPIVRTFNTISGNSLRAMGFSMQVLKIHFYCQWLMMLPACALIVLYFELSLFWAFLLFPLEEIVKAVPFYKMLKRAGLK